MKANAPISVIIPCFNGSKTIQRAIESVWEQTLIPHEVIIINDASTDHTAEIILRLQSRYPEHWIKLYTLLENKGAAFARNFGISVSRKEIIALLDADDAWHPQKIQLQFYFLEKHPNCGICGTGYKIITPIEQKASVLTPFEHSKY